MIEVGEFIRTPNGEILQLEKIFTTPEEQTRLPNNYGIAKCNIYGLKQILVSKETAKKSNHSFNLIDLIEVGDYVNGHKIESILNALSYFDIGFNCWVGINELQIKTIVTKEQFKAMEYEVRENE